MSALITVYRSHPSSVATPNLRELWIDNDTPVVINTVLTQLTDNGFLVADVYELSISYDSGSATWLCNVTRENWDVGEESDADDTVTIAVDGLPNRNTVIEGIDIRTLSSLNTLLTYTATIYVGHHAGIISDGATETPVTQWWARNEGTSTATNAALRILSDAHPVNAYSGTPGVTPDLIYEVRESRYPASTWANNPTEHDYVVSITSVAAANSYNISISTDGGGAVPYTGNPVTADESTEYELADGIFVKFASGIVTGDLPVDALIKISDGKDHMESSLDDITYNATDKTLTGDQGEAAGTLNVGSVATWYERVVVPDAETPDDNARKAIMEISVDTI